MIVNWMLLTLREHDGEIRGPSGLYGARIVLVYALLLALFTRELGLGLARPNKSWSDILSMVVLETISV